MFVKFFTEFFSSSRSAEMKKVTDIKQILILDHQLWETQDSRHEHTRTENDESKLLFNNRVPSDKLFASLVDVMAQHGEKSLNHF